MSTRFWNTATVLAAGSLAGGILLATPAAAAPGSGASDSPAEPDACAFQLFDGDDFDPTDDYFTLTEPGDYAALDDLPGANQGWTDEADSYKVGPGTTVTVYAEENFGGPSEELTEGEYPNPSIEPSSLTMTCDGAGSGDGTDGDENAGGTNGEPAACTDELTDVDADNPFCDAITWAANHDIVEGYDNGTFGPTTPTTRQATAALLYRINGQGTATCDGTLFDDIDADNPFCDAITWAANHDIVEGYDNGTFGPTAPTTRQATAALLYRLNGQD